MLVGRKPLIILGYCSFAFILVLVLGYQQGAHEKIPAFVNSWSPVFTNQNQIQKSHVVPKRPLLKGNATTLFRDNLLPDVKYITGWVGAGFTNQFMGVSHLLYISLLTPDRIPIIQPFLTSHLPLEAGTLAVSEVFDLDRWSRSIHHPILEWKDVKVLTPYGSPRREDGTEEFLACWSTWMTGNLKATQPAHSMNTRIIGLDISYTPVTKDFRARQDIDTELFILMPLMASLSGKEDRDRILHSFQPYPESTNGAISTTVPSERGVVAPPDDHLLCFDDVYYLGTHTSWEFSLPWSPMWNIVGRHAHWSHPLRSSARKVLAKTLGVDVTAVMNPVPGDFDYEGLEDDREYTLEELEVRDHVLHPYIVIHARHGDFGNICKQRPDDPCFTSMDEFAESIKEIMDELLEKQGVIIRPEDVIMTSDEQDEEWWDSVKARGWKRVIIEDEDIPEGPKGLWYRTLVETCIQSWSKGFIGTYGSTMSLFGGRRSEVWQNAVTRHIKWGPHLPSTHGHG